MVECSCYTNNPAGGMSMSTTLPHFCPKCNGSAKFYRFGRDKSGNQKYQCRECKHQFTLVSLPPGKRGRQCAEKRKYPSCPKCGKASFLHHDFPTHQNFRCADKKCNHSFFCPKDTKLPPSFKAQLCGKTDFKHMRHPVRLYSPCCLCTFSAKTAFGKFRYC